MAKDLSKNTFSKGLNKDLDPKVQPPETYRDAVNMDFIDNGNLTALTNTRGTANLAILLPNIDVNDLNILGSFDTQAFINGEERPVLLYFISSRGSSFIVGADLQNEDTFMFFSDEGKPDKLGFNNATSVDAYYNKERGINKVYFVDHVNPIRRVDLVYPNTQTFKDLYLRPLGVRDDIDLVAVRAGGNITAGSYQFSFRYYNTVNNKYSTFSAPTNPIPVQVVGPLEVTPTPLLITGANYNEIVGGVPSSVTNKLIEIRINQFLEAGIPIDALGYDSIQVAVIKNVSGSTIPETTAGVISPSKEFYNDPSSFTYTGLDRETLIPIEEIVIEDSPVNTSKTLAQKDNRLFLGNIKYNDLYSELESNPVEISDACTIKKQTGWLSFTASTNIGWTNTPTTDYFTVGGDQVDFFDTGGTLLVEWIGTDASSGSEDVAISDAAYNKGLDGTIVTVIGGNSIPSSDILIQYTYKLSKNTKSYGIPEDTFSNKGHFREEVYRYGITYHDRFGNYSPVQVFDFTEYNRNNENTSKGVLTPISISIGAEESEFTFTGNIQSEFPKGELLIIKKDNNACVILKVIPNGVSLLSGDTVVKTNGVENPLGFTTLNISNTTICFALGDKYSHSDSGIDWKYPARCITDFSLFDKNGNISALGLKLSGIKNHPSWARGFKIVRMPRMKNILFQTPHVPTAYYQGVSTPGVTPLDYQGPFVFGIGGSVVTSANIIAPDEVNTIDFVGIKKHNMGTARNVARVGVLTPTGITPPVEYIQYPCYYMQESGSSDLHREVPQAIWAAPNEYVYNFGGNPFNSYSGSASDVVKIVDATAFIRDGKSERIPEFSSAIVFSALTPGNYFYSNDGVILRPSGNVYYKKLQELEELDGAFDSDIKIKSSVPVAFGDLPTTLSESPSDDNELFNYINNFNNGQALSEQQGEHPSVEQTSSTSEQSQDGWGNDVENQRGIVLSIDGKIEDLTKRAAFEEDVNNVLLFPSVGGVSSNRLYTEGWTITTVTSKNYAVSTVSEPASSDGEVACHAYVLNIERGLPDDRYGEVDAATEFVSTGHYQSLSADDIINNTPFDAEIFGGDCFITRTALKITDAGMIPINYSPNVIFTHFPLNSEYKLGSTKESVEILDMYLESEVNTALAADPSVYPHRDTADMFTYSKEYLYPYHFNYSNQNFNKIFVTKDQSQDNVNDFPARLQYSDLKVLQSDIEGFDRFRILNLYDLEQEYGGITKVIKTNDSELWAIQESGVRYLPIGKEIVELQDGVGLTVGGESVIGRTVKYLTRENGCQHIKTVVFGGNEVYFVDAIGKEVVAFQSQETPKVISDLGMYSYFNEQLTSFRDIPDNALMSGYDFNKDEYWIVYNEWTDKKKNDNIGISGSSFTDINRGGFNVIFSSKFGGIWKTFIDTGLKKIWNAQFANQEFHLAGREISPNVLGSSDLNCYKMYAGNRGIFFGDEIGSSLDIVVNMYSDYAKTFDVVTLNSIERLNRGDFEVVNETPLTPNQIASNVDLLIDPRQGMYYVNQLRDDVRGGRLRGQYMNAHFEIENNDNRDVRLSSVMTKFRLSNRNY